jgi:zinc transporter ZupT
VSWSTELLLGLLAGGTIYIGLLAGRFPARRPVLRTGLSMFAAGILLFLMVEISGNAAEQTASAWRSDSPPVAAWLTVLLVGGFALGLVGLVVVTKRMLSRARQVSPQQMSLAIATGIGLHNLSEGLAIGASAAVGRIGLAVGLVAGFAAHNATEGFGILGPAAREGQRVPWSRLGLLGLIGGGPTFVGVLLGGVWTSQSVSVLVLSIAAGALLYVVYELLSAVRKQGRRALLAGFLIVGVAAGWGTEVAAEYATTPASGSGQTATSLDGD